jgi:DNA-binding beta-propeller fold protein YncE
VIGPRLRWRPIAARAVLALTLPIVAACGGLPASQAAQDNPTEEPTAAPTEKSKPTPTPTPSPTPPFPSALVPTLAAEIPIGQGTSLLYAEGSLWVSELADNDGGGYILRIDATTNEVIARIPVAAVPSWEVGGGGLAFGAGSIWVIGSRFTGAESTTLVQRVDPTSNEVVTTISLDGGTGYDIAVDVSGVWALYAGRDEFTRVAHIDPSTNELLATVSLNHRWAHWIEATSEGVVVLEHRVFDEGFRSGVFTVIDPTLNHIVASEEPVPGNHAWGLSEWGEEVWTSSQAVLARIDPTTGQLVQSAGFGTSISGEGITGGEGGIWFVGYHSDGAGVRPMTLNRFNTTIDEVDVSSEIRSRGVAIEAGGGSVWLMLVDGKILRYDLEPPSEYPGPEDLEPLVAPLVAEFTHARIDGVGAEAFLKQGTLEEWSSPGSGLLPLYSPRDLRYESFEIVFSHSLGDGTFEVGMRMFGSHLDGIDEWDTVPILEETLLIGPGDNETGEPHLLLIDGARSGLDGP